MNQGQNQPRLPNVEPAIFEGVSRINYILADCPLTRAQHTEVERTLHGILVYTEGAKRQIESLTLQVQQLTQASTPDGAAAPVGSSAN